MDGNTSHITWQFFDYGLKNKIVPFCLPPHSTHLLQPLNVGLFGPSMHYYSEALDGISDENRGLNKAIFLKYVEFSYILTIENNY